METAPPPAAPKVSAFIPIYKPEFLAEAIESLLNQSMTEFELILVNGGSPYPEVDKIARRYAAQDGRVRYVALPDRIGPSATRNHAAALAKAPILMWMDDDDISLPERMREQYDFLQANPKVGAVNCGMYVFGEGRKTKERLLFDEITIRKPPPPAVEKKKPVILGAPVMARKAAFEAIGGFRPFFIAADDTDFGLRMEEKFSVAFIPSLLYRHRQHSVVQVSNSVISPLYATAAALSAVLRRSGKPDIIGKGTQLKDALKSFYLLPASIRHDCIRKLRQRDPANFGDYRRYFPNDRLYFLMQAAKIRIKKWRRR